MSYWLQKLNEEELQFLEPVLFIFKDSPEDAAKFLYKEGFAHAYASADDKDKLLKRSMQELTGRPPKKYWDQVKSEIYSLICTESEKYAELRNKLSQVENSGTKALVALVSASVGSILGIEAGVISGFVTLALHSAIRIGKEAYCAVSANHS